MNDWLTTDKLHFNIAKHGDMLILSENAVKCRVWLHWRRQGGGGQPPNGRDLTPSIHEVIDEFAATGARRLKLKL